MSRGGARPGAGRPKVYGEGGLSDVKRSLTRSITLTAEEWEYLMNHFNGSMSDGIRALIRRDQVRTAKPELD